MADDPKAHTDDQDPHETSSQLAGAARDQMTAMRSARSSP